MTPALEVWWHVPEWPTADEWQAVWAAATFVVAVAAAIVALSQHRDSIRSRQEQARPYVNVDFAFIAPGVATIEVKNTGLTAATDLRFTWSETPVSDHDPSQRAIDRAFVDGGIPFLAPGRSIRFLLGAFDEGTLPRQYTVETVCRGSGDDREWRSSSVLDLDQWAGALADRNPYESISQPLGKLVATAAPSRLYDVLAQTANSLRLYLDAQPEVEEAHRREDAERASRIRELQTRHTRFSGEDTGADA